VPVAVSHPAPHRAEQDPEELLGSALAAIKGALAESGRGWEEVACLSIATQTETFVVWDRATGRALGPAVGWQDHRTAAACAALAGEGREALVRERTGLPLDPTFPATKLRAVLDGLGADPAEVAYGDVVAWLLARLGVGAPHVTDVANASRSSLVSLATLAWDPELLDLFGVPATVLPRLVDSDEPAARTRADLLGGEVPIAGLMGDQQASLFGHGAWSAGEAKVTLGTGAFLWSNAGAAPPSAAPGVVATCAWKRAGEATYALEGMVPAAGAVVDWLVGLGLLASPADLNRALAVGAGSAVVAVPALAGLGTPSWRTDVAGSLSGLTQGVGRDEIVAATLDGVLHQVADAVDALGATAPIERLRVDGGLARSPVLLQRLADLTGTPVARSSHAETTAVGVAMMGGLATGAFGSAEELHALLGADLALDPALAAADREASRARWREARDAALAL
jgi:glycerol kinase